MKGGHSHWQGLMILVEGEAEDRVDQSAFIKMGLDRPIGQFSLPHLRQHVPSFATRL